MKAVINKKFHFEAAHYLPHVDSGHQCHGMHGHSYQIKLTLMGPVDKKAGWVMDLGEVSRICKPLIKCVDHKILNEVQGLENPTSENLATWFVKNLHGQLPLLTKVTVMATKSVEVTVKVKDFLASLQPKDLD